jgi:hypothetical protein
LGNKFTEGNLPFIVPVVAGVVEGNAGFVYTSVTGAGVVTPEQTYFLLLQTHIEYYL